jgi:hypothetical protein
MPYKLLPLASGKYTVVNTNSGKTYSSHGMSKQNALAQLRILTTNEPTRTYAYGGVITKDHTFHPRMATFKIPVDRIDNIPILAQEGELMIPLNHVDKVKQFLREKRIKLPGM